MNRIGLLVDPLATFHPKSATADHVGPADSPVPVFDTSRLHADRAVELALEDDAPVAGGAQRPARA